MANPVKATAKLNSASRDVGAWIRAKQESRDQDAAALASGARTVDQLRVENTFLPANWKPDWSRMPRL